MMHGPSASHLGEARRLRREAIHFTLLPSQRDQKPAGFNLAIHSTTTVVMDTIRGAEALAHFVSSVRTSDVKTLKGNEQTPRRAPRPLDSAAECMCVRVWSPSTDGRFPYESTCDHVFLP